VKGGQSAHWKAVTGDVKNQYLVAIYDLEVVTGQAASKVLVTGGPQEKTLATADLVRDISLSMTC
jgi:hypothetical protein